MCEKLLQKTCLPVRLTRGALGVHVFTGSARERPFLRWRAAATFSAEKVGGETARICSNSHWRAFAGGGWHGGEAESRDVWRSTESQILRTRCPLAPSVGEFSNTAETHLPRMHLFCFLTDNTECRRDIFGDSVNRTWVVWCSRTLCKRHVCSCDCKWKRWCLLFDEWNPLTKGDSEVATELSSDQFTHMWYLSYQKHYFH